MGSIGHFALGLAAKPSTPQVPIGVLLLATWILNVLTIAFSVTGIEAGGGAGLPRSHGLFMSVVWSPLAALLAASICHDHRTGTAIGLLVLSHWVLTSFLVPFPSPAGLGALGNGITVIRCHPTFRCFSVVRRRSPRTIQLHQRDPSHGSGVWNVHPRNGRVRSLSCKKRKEAHSKPVVE